MASQIYCRVDKHEHDQHFEEKQKQREKGKHIRWLHSTEKEKHCLKFTYSNVKCANYLINLLIVK